MRFSLTRRQRGLVLFCSASGYTAWFAGLGDRSDAQVVVTQPAPTVTIRDERPPQRVDGVIRRDPFAGKPADGATGSTAEDDAGSVRGGARSSAPTANEARDATDRDVPNIDGEMPVATAPAPAADVAVLTLRATIVGPNPVAYVENGTTMDIVRVGDTLGDRRVAKIDLRGITFADGTRLGLPATYGATPTPQAPAGTPVTLEALRKLLLARPPAAASANATTTSTAAPAVTTAPYPSPAPLATADTRGLPIGANPTPDANAATAYPYPYPYAPPVRH